MLTPQEISARVDTLKARTREQHSRMRDVLAIREGRFEDVAPGVLPSDWPKPIVANMIDVAAKDMADNVGGLPQFNCRSANMTSDRARKFADKRTKIVQGYIEASNLGVQMYGAVDRLMTYGYTAFIVEPDAFEKTPKVRAPNVIDAYYQQDRWGRRTRYFCHTAKRFLDELIVEYPEVRQQLIAKKTWSRDQVVELVEWYDDDQHCLVILDGGILLEHEVNQLSRCPVRVVEMPKVGDNVRGQFDDVVWVQIARAVTQLMALQATEESVNAPLVVPDDVQDVAFGPKEIIRTQSPQGVGKVSLQVPQGVWAENQNLANELRIGARYPEGRSGSIDASIITGQGVEALMGTFSTLINTAQLVMATGLTDVVAMCFELDQKLWPEHRKTIRGNDSGARYEITYTPKNDIAGDYHCDVSYGLTAGLDPNRALVFILQALTAGLISKDTAQRQLPVDINVVEEQERIDVEMLQSSLAQAIAGYAQSIPMMATQGMDPSMAVSQIAEFIRLRRRGESAEEAASKVFAPPPPPEEGTAPEDPLAALMAGGGGAGGPMAPAGGEGGGAAQDLLMTLTGLTPGGDANLQSTVSRRQPI